MPESARDSLFRIAAPIWLGLGLVLGVISAVGAIVLLGAGTGLGTGVGIIVLLVVLYVVGRSKESEERARLEADAFECRRPAADADAVHDFYVRQWRPDVSARLPEFVERSVMSDVRDGLARERFVILKGPRFSGKSRIVFEAMLETEQMVLIARPGSSDATEDALMKLMKDPRGFAHSSQRQVLVLRDCQERLLAGSIGGHFMRTWLDNHPNVSVLATLSSADLAQIDAAGSRAGEELGKLEAQAAVVPVSGTLDDEEMKKARATFTDLTDGMLTHLSAYLCSGETLEERFKTTAREGHGSAKAIVRAAADWERAGIARPVPRRFLETASRRYVDGPFGDFEAELEWALERVNGAAALLYEVEGGFVVDGTARDMLDSGEVAPRYGRELPPFAWEGIQEELLRVAGTASEVDLVDDLVGLERGASERGQPDIADWAYQLALKQDAGPRRISQHLAAALKSGPPPSIMRIRDGDGVRRRLTAVSQMVEARNARAKRRRARSSASGDEWLAEIYAHQGVRAVARWLVLFLADASSVAVGLAIGVAMQAWLSDSAAAEIPETLWRALVPAVAGVVVVFGVLSLYKQDAPRAHLSRIISAMSMLGFVALVTSLVKDFDPLATIAAALTGIVFGTGMDYRLRVRYDKVSRDWVKRHKFEVWLLVIGNSSQFKAAEAAMDDTTRPTEVIGYLTTDRDDLGKDNCLGVVDDLSKVLSPYEIERVLIADPEMPPEERQDLADECHMRGLPVEAVPSLADIQMGDCEFVAGNSLVLIEPHPLWQRNVGFFVKRAFDFVMAAVGLILLSIPLAVIAGLIRLIDKHPPLTREWRVGLAGNVFGMHRFRTTTEDPEASDPRTIDTNRLTEGTTWLGKILCGRGLDELPQLINVLRGEMSLTGPRPLYIRDHIKLEKGHLRRYVVRPGMTGPWQVCERPEFSADELTRLDVAYLRNRSFITDLDLIVKAMRIAIRGRNSFGEISHEPGVEDPQPARS